MEGQYLIKYEMLDDVWKVLNLIYRGSIEMKFDTCLIEEYQNLCVVEDREFSDMI